MGKIEVRKYTDDCKPPLPGGSLDLELKGRQICDIVLGNDNQGILDRETAGRIAGALREINYPTDREVALYYCLKFFCKEIEGFLSQKLDMKIPEHVTFSLQSDAFMNKAWRALLAAVLETSERLGGPEAILRSFSKAFSEALASPLTGEKFATHLFDQLHDLERDHPARGLLGLAFSKADAMSTPSLQAFEEP